MYMCLQKRSSNGAIAEETRNILLYNGKIHLNLVQQLFDLHIVEMKHGKSSLLFVLVKTNFWEPEVHRFPPPPITQ